MIPKMGKLTLTGRKLLNVLLHSTQGQIAQFTLEGKEVPAGHLFSARLCDLLNPIEHGGPSLRFSAKGYFLEMRGIRLEWEAPDMKAKDGVVWSNYDLLSEAQLEYSGEKVNDAGYQNNALIAKWAFPPSIFKTLRYPDLYAQICIYQIAKLGTYEALALYEICSRYRTNPEGLTSSKDPEWWTRALSNKVPTVGPDGTTSKLRSWPKFKNDKVSDAIIQINERTDLEIALIEKKVGKKITLVQFSVKRKDTKLLEDISTKKLSVELAQIVSSLGISLADVSALVKSGHSEAALMIAVNKLVERCARTDLVPVESKLAYLNSVLNEVGKYVETAPKPELKPAEITPPVTAVNFVDQRRAKLKSELLELPDEKQQKLALAGLDLLRRSGIITPAITRAFDSRNWVKNGLFLSKMIEVYAVEKYGKDWMEDASAS